MPDRLTRLGRKLERNLPADPNIKGPVVVPENDLRAVIRECLRANGEPGE